MKLYHWMSDFSGTPDDSCGSPQRVYARWLGAMRARDSDRALCLYADDAVLLGDLAPGLMAGREGIRQYLDSLIDRHQFDVAPCEVQFRDLGTDLAVAKGVYALLLGGVREADPLEHVLERFTMVFRRDPLSSDWKIADHHSSRVPEPVVAIVPQADGRERPLRRSLLR
jgi:uncharacterized protein (TIGR02246 family)